MSERFDVVVVGSVNRDYVCRVDVLPAPGETILGGEASVGSGGKGGNQAVAASLLGARTALVARVGEDEDGRALVCDLVSAGVDTMQVLAVPRARTGMAFVTVDAHGENSIVVAPGANNRLEPSDTGRSVRALLGPGGVVVVQAEIPDAVLAAAVEGAEATGCRAVVNLAPYRHVEDRVLARSNPLVVNETEASSLLGREVRGVDEALGAVGELARRARSAVVTIGPEGAVVGEGDLVQHVAARSAEAVDTTGAGDAFVGALATMLSAGHRLTEAVRVGVLAGTYAVGRPGAQAAFATPAALGLDPRDIRG